MVFEKSGARRVSKGVRHMVLLRQSLLRRHLGAEQVAALEHAAVTHLLPACAETMARLGAWLTELLARTHGAPEMLRHPAAVESLELELVTGLSRLLQLSAPARQARPSLRRRGFDRAIEYIRHADLDSLDPAALYAAAAVSPRTLEYAFREIMGVSPAAFIRQLRLHALRRALLAGVLGESTVTELAYHLGFTQLGRLAGSYRSRFGESPSVTLARPYRDEAPRLWAAPLIRYSDGARMAAQG